MPRVTRTDVLCILVSWRYLSPLAIESFSFLGGVLYVWFWRRTCPSRGGDPKSEFTGSKSIFVVKPGEALQILGSPTVCFLSDVN